MKSKTALSVVSLVVAAGLAGCGSNNAGGELPTLDVEAAIDNERTFDLSEITSEIEFIALDGNSEESLVGNISKMQESRDRFYISDSPRNPVKVFDKAGNFLSTRGLVGRGPNELPFIGNLAVDYRQDNVYLMGGSSTIAAYDADGNPFARNDSITQSAGITYVDDKLIVLKGSSGPDGKTLLFEIFSPDLQKESDIYTAADKGETDQVIKPMPGGGIMVMYMGRSMSDNGKRVSISYPMDDTVFHYRGGRAPEPAYRLDMGRYTVPAGVTGENPSVPWNDLFRPLGNILEGDRYIVAMIISYSADSSSIARVILDKHDPAGGFSPLGPDGKPGLFLDGIRFNPIYIRDNRLVGHMQAINIVDNAAAITNTDLKALAATLKEDSNPVIVVAKLKQ